MGPAGATGATGAAGPTGATGATGRSVLNGTGPVTADGNVGDFYINTTSNKIFGPKTSGGWPTTGLSMVGVAGATGATGATGTTGAQGIQGIQGLTGATGATGAAGADGNSVLSGTVNPTSSVGGQGDFYFNTATAVMWGPKGATSWPSSTVSLVGPAGATGATGAAGAVGATGPAGKSTLNGTTGPTSSDGNVGDFFINTTSNKIFGPKTSGGWPTSGISMVGTAGVTTVGTGTCGAGQLMNGISLSGTSLSVQCQTVSSVKINGVSYLKTQGESDAALGAVPNTPIFQGYMEMTLCVSKKGAITMGVCSKGAKKLTVFAKTN